MRVKRTDPTDADFASLTRRLDEFLAELNGEQHAFYDLHNRSESLESAVVAYVDGSPVGCGAFKDVENGTIEIKRMFVEPSARGRGVGRAVLVELHRWAAELGHERSRLETSKRLEAAVRLYSKAGYEVIPNYAPYTHVDDSVCMARALDRCGG
jgi:putative acetyltransferase